MITQLGAFFPTRDMPADGIKIRDWAQAAEDLGFDYVEVSDHVLGADRRALPEFQGPYDVDDSFHETFCKNKKPNKSKNFRKHLRKNLPRASHDEEGRGAACRSVARTKKGVSTCARLCV